MRLIGMLVRGGVLAAVSFCSLRAQQLSAPKQSPLDTVTNAYRIISDAPPTPSRVQLDSPKAVTEPPNKAKPPPEEEKPMKPVVIYSGLLADLKRSTNRWRMFRLRTPLREVSGAENLSFYPNSEHPQGIVLFRVKF